MSFIIYLLSGLYVCLNLFWCLLVGDHSFLWMPVNSFSIWNTMFTFDMQLSSVQRIMLWRVLLVISRWKGLLTRTREDYSLKTKVKVLVCVLEIDRFVLKGVFVVIVSLMRNIGINRLFLKTCDMWLVRETKLSLLIEVLPTWVPQCTNAPERFFDFSRLSSFWFVYSITHPVILTRPFSYKAQPFFCTRFKGCQIWIGEPRILRQYAEF